MVLMADALAGRAVEVADKPISPRPPVRQSAGQLGLVTRPLTAS